MVVTICFASSLLGLAVSRFGEIDRGSGIDCERCAAAFVLARGYRCLADQATGVVAAGDAVHHVEVR